jgi:hypothetical protein
MKMSINDEQVLVLNETQRKVICNDIFASDLEDELTRRAMWIWQHKYDQCFKRLKQEWEPKLKAAGVESIPLDNDAFAQLVFSQPDYKDRKQRADAAAMPEL